MPAGQVATSANQPVPLHRNRDFLLLWSGQAVSVLGSQASRVAYPLLVLALTGSPARAGLAGAAATVPYALLPLVAGAFADRHDRRRMMIGCDTLRLLALAGVAISVITGAASYQLILAAGFAEGVGTACFTVASRGAVPMLVHPSQRATAVARNEARTFAAQLAGPVLGGGLFGLARFLPFAADALSYVASLGALVMIRAPMQEASATTGSAKDLVRDLADGLRWTWNQPFLRRSSLAAAMVNLCLQVQSLTVIVLARDDGASPAVTGVIVACAGLGGLLGSVASPWLVQRIRPGMIITGCLWGFALCTGVLCAVPGALWLCPVMTALGLMMPPWNVASQAYRMQITPNQMLARASSVAFQIAWGVIPLGSLLAGGLLAAMSAASVMAIAALLLGITAVIATSSRPMRNAGGADDPYLVA